jgi:hypothetical protein
MLSYTHVIKYFYIVTHLRGWENSVPQQQS